MDQVVETGLLSFQVLAQDFASSVLHGDDIPTSSLSQSDRVCYLYGGGADAELNTEFLLDTKGIGEDPCEGSDWVVLAIQFLMCLAFTWLTRWCIWEPLAQILVFCNDRATKRRLSKFSGAASSTFLHSLSAVFGYRILLSEHQDWLLERDEWKVTQETVPSDIKFFYLLYIAHYASNFVSFFLEASQTDTLAFVTNHLASIALFLVAAAGGYVRIGCVVMGLFDWAVILLSGAKLFKYCSEHRDDWCQFTADHLFEGFALVFFLTRNILFSYVVYSLTSDLPDEGAGKHIKFLLLILFGITMYWLWLIVRAVIAEYSSDVVSLEDAASNGYHNMNGTGGALSPDSVVSTPVRPTTNRANLAPPPTPTLLTPPRKKYQ